MRNKQPRSLLVMQTAFIGDVVLVTPLLKALHEHWPAADLYVMVRPPADNLLETLTYISTVLKYDKYKIKHVMNVTDVGHLTSDADKGEDKIEKAAKERAKDSNINVMAAYEGLELEV